MNSESSSTCMKIVLHCPLVNVHTLLIEIVTSARYIMGKNSPNNT